MMSVDTRRTFSAHEYGVGAKVCMRTRLPLKVVTITDIVLSLPSKYSGPRDWYKADVWIGTDDGAAPWYYWTRCDDDGNPYPDQETSPAVSPPPPSDVDLNVDLGAGLEVPEPIRKAAKVLMLLVAALVPWAVLIAMGYVALFYILKLVEQILG